MPRIPLVLLSLTLLWPVGDVAGQIRRTGSVRAVNLNALSARAEAIVIGRVTAVVYRMSSPAVRGGDRMPHAFVTYAVREVLYGRLATPSSLTLRVFGGPDERGGVTSMTGYPMFEAGHEDLLFIQGNTTRPCPLVGCSQGRLRIVRDTVFGAVGKPVVALRGDSIVTFGGTPRAELRRVTIPITLPTFDQAARDPANRAQMRELLRTSSMAQLRARYERERPRTVTVGVTAGEEAGDPEHRSLPPVEALRPVSLAQVREAVRAAVARQPARSLPVVPNADPVRPFTVAPPRVAPARAR